ARGRVAARSCACNCSSSGARPSGSDEFMRRDRERPQPFARSRENGIADRGCPWRYRDLADSTGPRIACHDMDIEAGHLIEPQHAIVVEVALLHPTTPERDVAPKCGREAVHDAALELRFDDAWIHGLSAVDDAGDLVDLEFASLDRHLGDLRDVRGVAFHEGDALEVSVGCMAPARALGDDLEHLQMPRLAREELPAKL